MAQFANIAVKEVFYLVSEVDRMSPMEELATKLHERFVDRSDRTLLDLPFTTKILNIAFTSWCNSLSIAYSFTVLRGDSMVVALFRPCNT